MSRYNLLYYTIEHTCSNNKHNKNTIKCKETTKYYDILCYAMLCYAMLCYAMLCYAML